MVRDAKREVHQAAGKDTGAEPPEDVVISGPSLLGNMAAVIPRIGASIAFALIFLFFLLSSGSLFYRKTVEALPSLSDKKRALSIASDIETELSRYLFAITLINLCLGLAIGSAMALVGLPMPAVFGALAFVLNFIPYLGAIAGIGLVGLVGLTEFGSDAYALVPPLVYLLITSIEGQFITPILVGRRLRMNAAAVFLSVAFWGWIWGVVGMFLAVPLMVCVKIVAGYIESLHPLANFLAAEEAQEETPPSPNDRPKRTGRAHLRPGPIICAYPASAVAGLNRFDQRCDAPQRHAAVLAVRLLRVHFQIFLAIALRHQILGRHFEIFGESGGDRFRAPIRQGEIGDIAADRVRVTFKQEDLAGFSSMTRFTASARACRLRAWACSIVAEPKPKLIVLRSIRRTLSRMRVERRTSSTE